MFYMLGATEDEWTRRNVDQVIHYPGENPDDIVMGNSPSSKNMSGNESGVYSSDGVRNFLSPRPGSNQPRGSSTTGLKSSAMNMLSSSIKIGNPSGRSDELEQRMAAIKEV